MTELAPGRRFAILQRDDFTCRYCGRTATAGELHVDHVRPRAAGGTDHPSNLVTSCKTCNSGKRARFTSVVASGWHTVVGKRFRVFDSAGGVVAEGRVVSDVGHCYYVVEFALDRRLGRPDEGQVEHRVVHLSALYEQGWVLYAPPPRPLARPAAATGLDVHGPRPERGPLLRELRERKLRDVLAACGAEGMTPMALAKTTGISHDRIYEVISRLARTGAVRAAGTIPTPGGGKPATRYALAPPSGGAGSPP